MKNSVVPGGRILSLRARFAYALGSAAYGVKENGLLYFLLLFYTAVLGLPPHWVGSVLALALVIDAISDPIVGYLSDKWQSSRFNWGRRHPFMYVAAVPMALAYAFLWNPPAEASQLSLLAWLISFVIIIRLLSTVYELPNAALGPELTSNYDERTALMSYRTAAATFGGLTIAFFNWHLTKRFFLPILNLSARTVEIVLEIFTLYLGLVLSVNFK